MISEVLIPEMLGTDLAIAVKKKNSGCRVLLFSGNAATRDLLKTVKDRGHDFDLLAKPVHPADLLARLKQDVT